MALPPTAPSVGGRARQTVWPEVLRSSQHQSSLHPSSLLDFNESICSGSYTQCSLISEAAECRCLGTEGLWSLSGHGHLELESAGSSGFVIQQICL